MNPARSLRFERAQLVQGGEIDDLISDCHAAAKIFRGIGAPEHRKGQILDGEFALGPVGRLHPAARPRIVRLIQ